MQTIMRIADSAHRCSPNVLSWSAACSGMHAARHACAARGCPWLHTPLVHQCACSTAVTMRWVLRGARAVAAPPSMAHPILTVQAWPPLMPLNGTQLITHLVATGVIHHRLRAVQGGVADHQALQAVPHGHSGHILALVSRQVGGDLDQQRGRPQGPPGQRIPGSLDPRHEHVQLFAPLQASEPCTFPSRSSEPGESVPTMRTAAR